MTIKPFPLTLHAYKMITPSIRHMEFISKEGAFHFTPGQFITFHFDFKGTSYNRSYSIASIPTKTNAIEIAVSPFPGGPGTEFLFHLNVGDEVNTTGPFGRLVLREEEKPERYVLVGTGTGVTPYRAMLPELHRRIVEENAEVVILLGVQTPKDLLYGEDFIEFASLHPRFHFYAFYSRQLPDNPKPNEFKGYVQSGFPRLSLQANKDIIYLCGNPGMIDESFTILQNLGFSTKDVRREKYISPKK